MNIRTAAGVLVLTAVFGAQSLSAAEIPNVIGTWKGMASPVHIGNTDHFESSETGAKFSDEKELTLKIDAQKGNNFSGELSSATTREVVLGAISGDGKSGVMIDQNGHFSFTLIDSDTLDYCYSHIDSKGSVADCVTLVKSK